MKVILENPAPHPRTDWATFSVPIEAMSDTLLLGDLPAYRGRVIGEGLQLMHSRVPIGALERIELHLRASAVSIPAPPANPAGAFAPQVHLLANGRVWEPVTSISEGICTILHMHGRIPGTQLVGEFWAYIFPGAHSVQWELMVVASDPTTPEVYQAIDSLMLHISGPVVLAPYWPNWRGAVSVDQNTIELARNTVIADTQGMAWAGAVALSTSPSAGAALHGPICAIAEHDRWGPFRTLPSSVDTGRYGDRLLSWHWSTTSRGDVWRAARLGLAPNSGQTGGQDDFGATKLGWALRGGPAHILEAYHSALHEAGRPGHWREIDGSPVEPWNHPNHVTWDGRTHFHPSVSSDRMGKGTATLPRLSGGYSGPDREHWSNNLLVGTYLLTGSLLLRRIVEKQARQVLSGETVDPRLSTSNAGAARGVGRTLLAASWITRCLDPQSELRMRVRDRIRDRLVIIERQTRSSLGPSTYEFPPVYDLNGEQVEDVGSDPRLAGPTSEPYLDAVGYIDDSRAMGSGVVCVAPWQEALAIVGLRAAALDGDPNADIVLRRAAAAWLRHGWRQQDGRWWMADYVARNDVTQRVRREGFEEWATGALRICTSIFDGEDAQKAQAILDSFPIETMAQAEWAATS